MIYYFLQSLPDYLPGFLVFELLNDCCAVLLLFSGKITLVLSLFFDQFLRVLYSYAGVNKSDDKPLGPLFVAVSLSQKVIYYVYLCLKLGITLAPRL